MVGGTGHDTLWGGWGNDLLKADDVLGTEHRHSAARRHRTAAAGRLNDTPDTHPMYEDRTFGGAGLDVLIGNTGGDRLIDWIGEFNSYIVPFAPFGIATVSPPGAAAPVRVPVRPVARRRVPTRPRDVGPQNGSSRTQRRATASRTARSA